MATITLRTYEGDRSLPDGGRERVETIQLPDGLDAKLAKDTCLVARDAWLTRVPEQQQLSQTMLWKIGLQKYADRICAENTVVEEGA